MPRLLRSARPRGAPSTGSVQASRDQEDEEGLVVESSEVDSNLGASPFALDGLSMLWKGNRPSTPASDTRNTQQTTDEMSPEIPVFVPVSPSRAKVSLDSSWNITTKDDDGESGSESAYSDVLIPLSSSVFRDVTQNVARVQETGRSMVGSERMDSEPHRPGRTFRPTDHTRGVGSDEETVLEGSDDETQIPEQHITIRSDHTLERGGLDTDEMFQSKEDLTCTRNTHSGTDKDIVETKPKKGSEDNTIVEKNHEQPLQRPGNDDDETQLPDSEPRQEKDNPTREESDSLCDRTSLGGPTLAESFGQKDLEGSEIESVGVAEVGSVRSDQVGDGRSESEKSDVTLSQSLLQPGPTYRTQRERSLASQAAVTKESSSQQVLSQPQGGATSNSQSSGRSSGSDGPGASYKLNKLRTHHDLESGLMAKLEGQQRTARGLLSERTSTSAGRVQGILVSLTPLLDQLKQAHAHERAMITKEREKPLLTKNAASLLKLQIQLMIERERRLVTVYQNHKKLAEAVKNLREATREDTRPAASLPPSTQNEDNLPVPVTHQRKGGKDPEQKEAALGDQGNVAKNKDSSLKRPRELQDNPSPKKPKIDNMCTAKRKANFAAPFKFANVPSQATMEIKSQSGKQKMLEPSHGGMDRESPVSKSKPQTSHQSQKYAGLTSPAKPAVSTSSTSTKPSQALILQKPVDSEEISQLPAPSQNAVRGNATPHARFPSPAMEFQSGCGSPESSVYGAVARPITKPHSASRVMIGPRTKPADAEPLEPVKTGIPEPTSQVAGVYRQKVPKQPVLVRPRAGEADSAGRDESPKSSVSGAVVQPIIKPHRPSHNLTGPQKVPPERTVPVVIRVVPEPTSQRPPANSSQILTQPRQQRPVPMATALTGASKPGACVTLLNKQTVPPPPAAPSSLPDLSHLVESNVLKAGHNVMSISTRGQTFRASLDQTGLIVGGGGERFRTPMAWYKALVPDSHKLVVTKKMAYAKVLYNEEPLDRFRLPEPREAAPQTAVATAQPRGTPRMLSVLRVETSPPAPVNPSPLRKNKLFTMETKNISVSMISDAELVPITDYLSWNIWAAPDLSSAEFPQRVLDEIDSW